MRIRWLNGWFPVLIVKVPEILPGGAMSLAALILVEEDQWGNEALLAHELQHSRDVLCKGGIIYAFRYVFSRSFRRRMEVRGYAAQVRAKPFDEQAEGLHVAAHHLSQRKDLRLTYENARKRLLKELGWEDPGPW